MYVRKFGQFYINCDQIIFTADSSVSTVTLVQTDECAVKVIWSLLKFNFVRLLMTIDCDSISYSSN